MIQNWCISPTNDFLENQIRERYGFLGTPLRLSFRARRESSSDLADSPGLALTRSELYNPFVSEPRRIDPAPHDWGATASPGFGRRVLHALSELFQTLLIAAILVRGDQLRFSANSR